MPQKKHGIYAHEVMPRRDTPLARRRYFKVTERTGDAELAAWQREIRKQLRRWKRNTIMGWREEAIKELEAADRDIGDARHCLRDPTVADHAAARSGDAPTSG